MNKIIFVISFVFFAFILSFLATSGIIYLICSCFGWNFSWGTAAGIWLVMILLRSIFRNTGGDK